MQEHWDDIYRNRASDSLSWYEVEPTQSLHFADAAGLAPGDGIVDIGAGASSFLANLVERGYRNLAAVDVSSAALDANPARGAMGEAHIEWIVGDLRELDKVAPCALWHDRAVFHFLTDEADRARYRATLADAVIPGGYAIIAVFGPEGPTRCSGLPVVHYGAEELAAELGADFEQIDHRIVEHVTPAGGVQQFLYTLNRRVDTVPNAGVDIALGVAS